MADKNLKARIVNKNGTGAEWEKATSFVPKKGELILYTDLNKIKIGDGVTKVNDLPFTTVPNKTSDLTNDSGYITNTSVDTKLEDKVSKTGDTMTGFLSFKCDTSALYAGSLGGTVYFGGDEGVTRTITRGIPDRYIPNISGYSVGGKNNVIKLTADDIHCDGTLVMNEYKITDLDDGNNPQDAVNYKQLSEKVSKSGDTMTGDLKMADSSGAVKGSVSDTDDGVALSAENGACLKVGTEAVTVCDNAGGASQIKGVKAPVDDTDAANKKYVDDAIPTTQIEELSSAVAKVEPFIVEVTFTGTPSSPQYSVDKTFSEIKAASDAGRLCYARSTNSGIMVPLVSLELRVDKKVAIFSLSNLSLSQFNTSSLVISEDNSVSDENFSSQSLIEATGLLKGDGQGGITAAVAGTDYAAASHTHTKANIADFPTSMTPTAHKNTHKTGGSDALTPADIGAVAVTDLIAYTATEIDTMWNAVTIN